MAEKIPFLATRAKLHSVLRLLLLGTCLLPAPLAAQSTKFRDTLDRVDPAAMRQLLAQAKDQPDVALTNIVPVEDNKFRFIFIWPAEYTMMTEDRINRSFAQRFLQFTTSQEFLATGYCLTPSGIGFLASTYGDQKVNMAYREIEVYREIGWRDHCRGKLVTSAQLAELKKEKEAATSHMLPVPPPAGDPGDGVSPFLKGIEPPE
jgi:hypothetical protein